MGFIKFNNKIINLALSFAQHASRVFEYKSKVNILFLIFFLLIGCGADDTSGTPGINPDILTQTNPIIISITPTTGASGGTITVNGFGFSVVPEENIITVGGASVPAQTYALLNPPANGAIEALTFQVPSGAASGTGGIFVTTVFGLTSNADVQFTVTP